MVSLNDLDPELANIIRGFTTDLEDLKIDMEAIRAIIQVVKGLSTEKITQDFKRVREENRQSGSEIVGYIRDFQKEFEREVDLRKKDKIDWVLEIDSIKSEMQKVNNHFVEKVERAIGNLKDLTVVLMENAFIEQAVENHKLVQETQVKKPDYEFTLPSQTQLDSTRGGTHFQLPTQTPQLFDVQPAVTQ